MTAGPRAGRPAGDMRTCCRTSGAASTPPAATRALRGTGGPVRVAPVPEPDRHPVASAFAEALHQAGCPVTDDLSGQRQEGAAWVDLAIAGGQRVSPDSAYLRPVLHRRNLAVQARCLATGLHVRHGRCTGVSYLRDGAPAQAHTGGEVIVCAGAIGSPQLLLLSGIGPAGQLRALGINPVADLPGVGENLQDHPVVMACYAAPGPLPRSRYNHGEIYAALRSGLAGACPDLHLFPILLPVAPAGYPAPPAGFALVAAVVAPDSRGCAAAGIGGPAGGTADRPRFPAGADRRGPAGGRPGTHPHGRRHRRVLARARRRGAPGRRRRAPAPGSGTSSAGPSAATTTRPGPAGWARTPTPARWWTYRCGSAASPGCGSPTPPSCRSIPNAHPNATVLAIAEKAAALISGQ